MFLCHEAIFHFRRASRLLESTPHSRLSKPGLADESRDLSATSSPYINLALSIDLAVEIPLIVAYHPATLIFGTGFDVPFPSILQIAAQLLFLVVVEISFHHWILCFLSTKGMRADAPSETIEQSFEPFSLVMEFMRPRGTLLIVMT